AKVSHETLIYPQHKEAIEDVCTACHAPLGHFNAKYLGATHYSIAEMVAGPLALDGVSCLSCHKQLAEGLGEAFSGTLHFDTFNVAYGPYVNPLVSPMLTETGYKPTYSPHIGDAGLCAGCHTLITETLGYDGTPTGDKFVEQATYHEWLNSVYRDSVSCQNCHMPDLGKFPVYLVTGAQTEPRSPFSQHEFVGGNVTMLKLLRNNVESLNLKASASQFDEVIAKTEDLLQNHTLDLGIELLERTADTAYFALTLTNKAGHKFPSGYPARRAFIEFAMVTESGDTLFISGKTDENFEVYGQNASYEPHYQTITSEEQVQIYELVMADVNGNVTTVLERAKYPLKDNRLPPLGFSTTHPAYDTTIIAGAAFSDDNFNKENSTEGSGTDVVFYNIPLNGNSELLSASARVFYQSTPPKWMVEMFAQNTPEIDLFRDLFDAADRTPVLVQQVEMFVDPLVAAGEETVKDLVIIYPLPVVDGRIAVHSSQPLEVEIFDLNGHFVQRTAGNAGTWHLTLPGKGVFLLTFKSGDGRVQTEKVIY
ncbi:MAG: T9SS type A sorting domain-containing protein, partial [Saprospiraceae bacterium]